jgi:flagellum-specific peptidoglycan hydrolase FlgJ
MPAIIDEQDLNDVQSGTFKAKTFPMLDALNTEISKAQDNFQGLLDDASQRVQQVAQPVQQAVDTGVGKLEDWTKSWKPPTSTDIPGSTALPSLQAFTGGWTQPSNTSSVDASGGAPSAAPGSAASSASAGFSQPAGAQAMPIGQGPDAGPIDNSSRESFIRTAYPHALAAAGGNVDRANQQIAMAISENGDIGTGKDLSSMGFNFSGVHAQPGEASFMSTDAGRPTAFRSYATPSEGLNGFFSFLQNNPRYAPALARYQQTGDIDELTAAANAAGYSETPGWQDNIKSIRTSQVEPITRGVQQSAQAAPSAPSQPSAMPQGQASAVQPTNYTQQGLADAGDPDAWAKCGPVAAYQFALRTGRNPTPSEVEKLAKDAGWTPQNGMAGFQSEAQVLKGLGIAARAENGVDWDKVITDVSRGNPVILQLPGHEGHYITAQGYDAATGKIDFGSTVGDLRAAGHKTAFTPSELENLGWGVPNAALYVDNPATPAPSVASQPAQMNRMSLTQPQGGDQWPSGIVSEKTSPYGMSGTVTTSDLSGSTSSMTPPSSRLSPTQPMSGSGSVSPDQMLRQPLSTPTSGPDTTTGTNQNSLPASSTPQDSSVNLTPSSNTSNMMTTPTFQDSQTEPASPPPTDAPLGVGASAPASAQPTPGAGAFQDDQTQNGWTPAGAAPGPPVPDMSGTGNDNALTAPSTGPSNPLDSLGPIQTGQLPSHTGQPSSLPDVVQAVNRGEVVNPFHWANEVSDASADQVVRQIGMDPGSPAGMAAKFIIATVVNPINWSGGAFSAASEGIAMAGRPILEQALPAIAEKFGAQTAGRLSTWLAGQGAKIGSEVVGHAAAGALTQPEDPLAGAAVGGVPLVGPLARGARGALGAAAESVDSAVRNIGSNLSAGAERAAAQDVGRPAGAGTYGVFGVAPPEAGAAAESVARPRFVPPDVRMGLGTPREIPDDPRLASAVEAVGGQITDRGVELHVTRAQGADAAGQVATRGGVFVEPVPEGGRSSFVTSRDNPNAVGGSVALPPTKTLYRKPLVIDDAPGANDGFDAVMHQLGVGQRDEAAISAAQDEVSRLYEEVKRINRSPDPNAVGSPEHRQIFAEYNVAAEHLRQLEDSAVSGRVIDRAISQARSAGPEGSPQRSQALKDLVSRYGGDPSLIDDLLKIRGADASESAWAIKENIVAANARRAGYDGVFTLKPGGGGPGWREALDAAIEDHPAVKAASAESRAAADTYTVAQRDEALARANSGAPPTRQQTRSVLASLGDPSAPRVSEVPTLAEAQANLAAAEQRVRQSTANARDVRGRVERELAPHKISEIFDVQQGRNPTPGAPNPRIAEAEQEWQAAAKATQDAHAAATYAVGHRTPEPEIERLWAVADEARARALKAQRALEDVRREAPFIGTPSYSLHPDVLPKPEPASTTAAGMAGITPVPVRHSGDVLASVNRALSQGAVSAVSGGVGAATNQQLNPDDPNAALKGFAVGAVAPYAISRGAGALARRFGRDAEGASGALATFGIGPKLNGPAESANPHIRDMARQMSGDYKTAGEDRPFAERVVSALTDRYAIHANVPTEAAARATKAGIVPAVERLAERVRENPNSIAAQRTREELAPALQALGHDDAWGAQYLAYRHNLDIAKGKAQDAYDAAIKAGRSPQAAQMVADRVRTSRQFSGGMTEKEITQALSDMQQEVGPQRFKNIVDSAQAFWDAGKQNMQAKLDEGIIDQDTYNTLTQKYPHYVRTDIADYAEKGPANPSPGGKALGIGSNGIKPISMEGTSKDRVNPIMSTIDSIYATENAVTRNKAARDLVAVRDTDPQTAQLFPEVAPDLATWRQNRTTMAPPDYTLKSGEQKMTQWENGVARQFVIPKEYAQLLTPSPGALLGETAAPLRTFFGVLKQLITTHNPAFQYLLSPARDAGDAVISMQTAAGAAARRHPVTTQYTTAGGNSISFTKKPYPGENALREAGASAAALPEAVMRLVQAAPQAFEGALSNQYGPRAAELLKAGAGFEGRPMGEGGLRSAMDDLKKTGGIQVQTPGDALRVLRSFATLGAERFGGRMEMIPRLAAANMEQARGGDTLAQSVAYKDSTIDFLRGGWLTRQASVPVMFLNPTVQSAAQVQRLWRKSPAAYMAALITTVGVPTILNEAWNRSDPQRAQAYDDRPDYLKNTGLVIEAPGLPSGTGRVGEKLPTSVYLPLGNHAYAARIFREALGLADQATGLIPPPQGPAQDRSDPMYWAKMGASVVNMFSPLKGGDATAVAGGLVPPGIRDVIEQGQNKDMYTGATIATDRTDQNASTLSKGIAAGANAAFGTEIRPSQVEHETNGPLGYGGRLLNAASDLATGRQRPDVHPIQDTPVVGGLAKSFVRDQGGQQFQNAADARTTPAVLSILHQAGLRSDQLPAVSSTISQVPLTRREQTVYQSRMNAYLLRSLPQITRDPDWRLPDQRKQVVQDAIQEARAKAEDDVLRLIPQAEQDRRIRRAAIQKAS